MVDTVVRVRTIFRKARGDCLGIGGAGLVLIVNSDIVVNTACRYDSKVPPNDEDERYSVKSIK
jgi:hypothetical protein